MTWIAKIFSGYEELIAQLRFENEQLRKERDRYIDLLMEAKSINLPNALPGDRLEDSSNIQPIRKITSRASIIRELEEEGRKKALEQIEKLKGVG